MERKIWVVCIEGVEGHGPPEVAFTSAEKAGEWIQSQRDTSNYISKEVTLHDDEMQELQAHYDRERFCL